MRLAAVMIVLVLLAVAGGGCFGGGDKPGPPPEPTATPAPPTEAPLATATPAAPTANPGDASPPASAPAEVHLLPLRDFPDETIEVLRAYFRERHGIEVGVLPRLHIDDSHADLDREQVIADRVVEAIQAVRPSDGSAPIIIGLTQYDIYMEDRPDWNFVFSMRDNRLNIAVVSTARMDPQAFGEPRDDGLLLARAAKMVGKNIGVMYLGLPMSDDPASVMYDGLTGLAALDRVDDDFVLR